MASEYSEYWRMESSLESIEATLIRIEALLALIDERVEALENEVKEK